jgi:hypothetical protein
VGWAALSCSRVVVLEALRNASDMLDRLGRRALRLARSASDTLWWCSGASVDWGCAGLGCLAECGGSTAAAAAERNGIRYVEPWRRHGFCPAAGAGIMGTPWGCGLGVPVGGMISEGSGSALCEGPARWGGGRNSPAGSETDPCSIGSVGAVERTGGRESNPPGVLLCSPRMRMSAAPWVSVSPLAVRGPGEPGHESRGEIFSGHSCPAGWTARLLR